MKDWNAILLETIIRENLLESKEITTTISKAGTSTETGQFKSEDTEFFNSLENDIPRKTEYKRLYYRFKSNAKGDGRSESTQFRINKIKDVLRDRIPKLTGLSKDPEVNTDKWIWIISNPFKTPEDVINKTNDVGRSFFRVTGMRKDDINRTDLVDRVNPEWGTLSNGAKVYSEDQVNQLIGIHKTPAPKPEASKTELIKAADLTDIKKLQEVLYGWFKANYTKLKSDFQKIVDEFKRTSFNDSTGWNGNLNDETKIASDLWAALYKKSYNFNRKNNVVIIDNAFRKALALEWFRISSKQESVIINEQDFTVDYTPPTTNPETGELTKVTTTTDPTTNTDTKKTTTKPKKTKPKPKPEPIKDDSLTSKQIETLLNPETTPVAKNFKLGTTYVDDKWIIQLIDPKKNPEFKISGKKLIPYVLRVINSENINQRFIVGAFIENMYEKEWLTLTIHNINSSKTIAYKPENIIEHPGWFREKLGPNLRGQITSIGIDLDKKFKNYFLIEVDDNDINPWSPETTKSTYILNAEDYRYSELSKTQIIVGKLYAGSAGAMTYEDTYWAGIEKIESWSHLVAVIKYMDVIAKRGLKGGGWWIPGNNTINSIEQNFKNYASFESFREDSGYRADEYAGYQSDSWKHGRWLDYLSPSIIYNTGKVSYQNNTYLINAFCSQFYGEFDGYETEYKNTIRHLRKISGDKLKRISGLGYVNNKYKIVLLDPKVRDSDYFDLSYD